MQNILYLGSKSRARHQLLKDAQINFVLVDQDADESKCDIGLSLRETVEKIALYKMEHVVLPVGQEGCGGKEKIKGSWGQEWYCGQKGQAGCEGQEKYGAHECICVSDGEVRFVLTADTLTQNKDGSLSGKPVDKYHAIKMIKLARSGATVGTAFCLDKKVWRAGKLDNAELGCAGKRECKGECKCVGKWELEKRIQNYVQASYELDIEDEWIDTYLEKSFGSVASGAVAIEGYGEQFLKTINGSHSTIVGLPMFELRRALQELGFFNFL